MVAPQRFARCCLHVIAGLADAARSKEWQAAAAAAQAKAEDQQQDRPEQDSNIKKKSSGLLNSFKSFVTDLMPFGLSSTLKGTHNNLQKLMTLQIAAMPEDLPAGEGYDTLEVRSACRKMHCACRNCFSLAGMPYVPG
jgi:hypothetical protein